MKIGSQRQRPGANNENTAGGMADLMCYRFSRSIS